MYDYLKEKYLDRLTAMLDIASARSSADTELNFTCPYCNEGKSQGKKRRGYILKKENYRFWCHNCNVGKDFKWFLKDMDETLFRQYFTENRTQMLDEFLKPTKIAKKKKEEEEDTTVYMDFDRNYVKATSIGVAVDYLKKRKIPKKYWDDIWWYIQPKPKSDEAWEEYKQPYGNSIIFPLRKNNKIYGFSSRNIENKFFHIHLAHDKNIKIFNYYNVNRLLDVYIFESIIDSFFMENSISLNGATASKKLINEFKNPIFVYDNDKTGIEKAKKKVEDGRKVFIMPKELRRFKDMNELIMAGVTPYKIKKLIIANTFSGKEALVRLALNF